MTADGRPTIVTIQMDAASAAQLTDLRATYFPPAINYLAAHLTLFHNLPGPEVSEILRLAGGIAATTPAFVMRAAGLMKLGRGVAVRLESPALLALRARLAAAFDGWLERQDRQKFRPHVTIQNKVAPDVAAATFDRLSAGFTPFDIAAEGLQFWRYDGGPWSPVAAVGFGEAVTPA